MHPRKPQDARPSASNPLETRRRQPRGMVRPEALSTRLHRGEAGCWFAPSSGPLSYPPEGNDTCFAVEDDSFWFQHRNACIVSLIERLPPPGTLFDVGGGNGAVAAAIQQAGFDVVLVEPGRQGALNARKRGVESVVCARLEDAGFPPATMPAVGLFDVLEHIEDDRSFLRILEALLIRGGRLYLTVPAYRALWSTEDIHAGHYRRYRLGGLGRLLSGAGFRVDYGTYMFWALPLPILLLRTLPSLIGLGPESGLGQARRDHATGWGGRGKLLDSPLRPELGRIRAKRRIPMGSSCLVAATRTS